MIILFLKSFIAISQEDKKPDHLDFYGHLMTDIGYDFNQIDSDWFDSVRPTKLPSYKNEFPPNGNIYFSVRQTTFGLQSFTQLPKGELKAKFEFDLYGTGPNAGQTTFHLREVYVEYGKFTIGQTLSPFMDVNMSPDILEYWGPSGRVFLRNIMIRYMPMQGDSHMFIALEMPGASADQGIYSNRIELKNVKPQFILPNFSADYRMARKWGYVESACLLEWIKWGDTGNGPYNLSGHVLAWGIDVSSNLHLSDMDLLQAELVYGQGIENYMNDAPADIGIKNNFTNPLTPILGEALPVLGTVAFLKHQWTNQLTSTIGFSSIHITNSDAQAPNAFRNGQYAIMNMLFEPVEQIMTGAELQWGKRNNFSDGFSSHIIKLQISCRYIFSQSFYTNKK